MDTKLVKVTNRSGGSVCYHIPERHLNRVFQPHETKFLSVEELMEVSVQPGGRELLYNFLLIQDAQAMRQILNANEAPEYWLTEENIPAWMTSCSLDEFKDGLDFAPEGVKDLIKDLAVSMPLNDMAKREAIKDMIGFDVTKAIEIERLSKAEDSADEAESAKSSGKRRSAAATINNITNTSATTGGYKVVSRGE